MASTWSTADDDSVDSAFPPDPPDDSNYNCDMALPAAPTITARKLLPLPPVPDPSSRNVSTRSRLFFKESSPSSLCSPYEGTARWRELLCVYFALIADAITANIIAPYAQDWVRDTYHVNNIGLYSGVLIGGVQFARALSSPFFGWLSDSMGRRLLMAGGLLIAGCLTMAGGLSKNFWMCFGFRFLAGILNPAEVVATAAIGDLATGRARTVAFGYSKAASQVAKILTSMIGTFHF
jgi:predicted MFS family arabinose efflux permease